MKKIIITFLVSSISIFSFAQVDYDIALQYLAKVGYDEYNLHIDSYTINENGDAWPAIGNYLDKKSLYYAYNNQCGHTLNMICFDRSNAAFKYSTYYIYNQGHDLVYYIYACEDCGRRVVKFTGNNHEIIETSDDELLAENYFFDYEIELNPKNVLASARMALSYCEKWWGMPDYQEEVLDIREEYKKINSNKDLTSIKKGNITAYYNNGKLVKFIVSGDVAKEYYLKNGSLFFAYYAELGEDKAKRAYFYGIEPFLIIHGKEKLVCEDGYFFSFSLEIREDYDNYRKIVDKFI